MITELSDECELPSRDEYMHPKTKQYLESYLIKDVIGIVRQYTDWKHFCGQALFSVPLKKFQDRKDVLFFRRTDKQDYTIGLSTPQTIKIPGHFEFVANLIQTGINILEHNSNVRYLVGYLPELETQRNEPNTTILGFCVELIGTLDFRSPAYPGVRTIHAHFLRIGQTIHLAIPQFEIESIIPTNRVLMTTFGTTTRIPQRFRPVCAAGVLVRVMHDGQVGVFSLNNMVQRPGFIQIHPDGNIVVFELNEFVNKFTMFGFDNEYSVQWFVDK